MKSSVKPILFSRQFGIAPSKLAALGVFDPALNVDTLLFPDPLLLDASAHPEMKTARVTFENHFEMVRKLLISSKGNPESASWRAAFRLLSFPEIKGTCLGYGSGSISGSGAGPEMTLRIMRTGLEIAQLGIDDPDLFMAMGLFEEDFGPDLIGDMFTNVAFGDLVAFNKRIYSALGVSTQLFQIKLKNGTSYTGEFARNPEVAGPATPIILMPADILRHLPVALDWKGVQEVSERNQDFRDSLNSSVAALWSKKTLEGKDQLKRWALSSPTAFGDLLDLLHGMNGRPYDFLSDRLGEVVWKSFSERVLADYPLLIPKPDKLSFETALDVVDRIIQQFSFLIEARDLWRELYTEDGSPRLEKSAQRLFYIAALSYCEANNIDITPEAETGRGPVDFKFSAGIHGRILVEIKLSRSGQLVKGFTKQLDLYNTAEKAIASRYLIIDVGGMGDKLKRVREAERTQLELKGHAPKILVVNGLPRSSASKSV
jgi:hypothetical protein